MTPANWSRADRHEFVYEPARGPPRRVRFEPRSDGTYERVEDVWTGCRWRPTGREPVDALHFG
ncbi:hypothetical protein BRC92_00295 [Halobacteriales archaeon QS_4_69_31]|nr:MAG: hypothetical protein BRC92_00295 [Halobacteriales archaeon QS_4_69_31]